MDTNVLSASAIVPLRDAGPPRALGELGRADGADRAATADRQPISAVDQSFRSGESAVGSRAMLPQRSIPARFQVAFSLAGEQRSLVRSFAEDVERRLGRGTVFLDEWYEHYLAGMDADIKLQDIYENRAVLAVVCVSSNYNDKPWTQAEHGAIRARYMQSGRDSLGILPIRVGEGNVAGIPFNAIVPDVRHRQIREVGQLIVDRLGLVSASLNGK